MGRAVRERQTVIAERRKQRGRFWKAIVGFLGAYILLPVIVAKYSWEEDKWPWK